MSKTHRVVSSLVNLAAKEGLATNELIRISIIITYNHLRLLNYLDDVAQNMIMEDVKRTLKEVRSDYELARKRLDEPIPLGK